MLRRSGGARRNRIDVRAGPRQSTNCSAPGENPAAGGARPSESNGIQPITNNHCIKTKALQNVGLAYFEICDFPTSGKTAEEEKVAQFFRDKP